MLKLGLKMQSIILQLGLKMQSTILQLEPKMQSNIFQLGPKMQTTICILQYNIAMTSAATFAATYMLFYVCGGGAEGGIVAFYDTRVAWKYQSKLQCICRAWY